MARHILEGRALLAMVVAASVGAWGIHAYPVAIDNPFLGLIQAQDPFVFRLLTYGYATAWFTTPFLVGSFATSMLAVVVYGRPATVRMHKLPAYPDASTRETPSLILGEAHLVTKPGRAPAPEWLTIPQRGLYTGVMVVGAVGTGKTSACMYPYVEQLVRWNANDPTKKIGGLVLEVKGDFCRQVHSMLQSAGRGDDYIEIGIDSGVCYNPLHNDLDPYAVAYAIAALLNNLFGKSKEPFWQQAYTDLLKFVIMLRRVAEGYTTLAEVYRYILDETLIDRDIRALKASLAQAPECLIISLHDYERECTHAPWSHWFREAGTDMAHPYTSELEEFLDRRKVPYRVARAQTDGFAARRHQLEAVERWYLYGWNRLDQRLRSSIAEGVVVFLSLFDDNLAVHRAFCPPRSAYLSDPKPGDPVPLKPLDGLLESGHVLALNFPVAMNPGLARIVGVMLKLDFQRAVLQRISRIAAHPEQHWRDLMFVCDEYHAFATVGEADPTGDERTFALSRQARLIPIVATQSISSLRSALPGTETWRTLLQCFRTKLFLATSDEFTARVAADLCGRRDQLKAQYGLSEAGQNAHISFLTGRTAASRHTLTASKTYSPHFDFVFPPRVFTELRNAEAIALPYDGFNPRPPQFCYLKPHYLNVQTSYFDHVARGAL